MVGSIVACSLLTDTVIVCNETGQFDVFQHALCWIHAERHLRRNRCPGLGDLFIRDRTLEDLEPAG